MQKYIDMTGKKVGLWNVLSKDNTKTKRAYWICRCTVCNIEQSVSGSHLREGIKGGCKSCRHIGNKKAYPKEWRTWQNIKTRALNPNRAQSERYIKLGIYKPWIDNFDLFLKEIGICPSKEHSIDRIDNTKGYFPGNIRWATRKEQSRNTSRNLILNGKVLIDTAKELGVPYNTLRGKYHAVYKN